MTTLTCTKCGAAFEGKQHRRNKPYCSNLCRYARDKRGEKHHGAKLTEAQVRAIRADPRRHKFIAADYGLHRVHISRIRSRAIWKHVNEPSRRPHYPSALHAGRSAGDMAIVIKSYKYC